MYARHIPTRDLIEEHKEDLTKLLREQITDELLKKINDSAFDAFMDKMWNKLKAARSW